MVNIVIKKEIYYYYITIIYCNKMKQMHVKQKEEERLPSAC